MEFRLFGVCAWWGEKLKMPQGSIKLFFIYSTFLTVGSPIIVYMVMAFVLKLRNMVRSKRNLIWDF